MVSVLVSVVYFLLEYLRCIHYGPILFGLVSNLMRFGTVLVSL